MRSVVEQSGGVQLRDTAECNSALRVAAFTLIELTLALAISAVVLVAINTLFFGALRLRERVSDAATQTLPTDHAIAVIKQDLMNIVPVGVLAGPMGTDAVATGMTQTPTLEVYTADGEVTADQPWGDIQRIDYALQSPTNKVTYAGRDLVRGVTRNLLAVNPQPPEPQTLLRDVQNLQFTYYDGTNWNDTWSTTLSNIPTAIRVLVEFNNGPGAKTVRSPLQFTVPISTWSSTNSITNQVSN